MKQLNTHIPWGKMLGLRRVHWYLCQILEESLRGNKLTCEAFICQLLRGLHQVALEGGSWDTACATLPGYDPCKREPHGLAEDDLHTVAAYRDAQRRIEGGRRKAGDEREEGGEKPPKGKGK